jgi:predicted small lipoprotein YifL
MAKNGFNVFHIIIITSLTAGLLTGLTGCGYKKPPYYPQKTQKQNGQERQENENK